MELVPKVPREGILFEIQVPAAMLALVSVVIALFDLTLPRLGILVVCLLGSLLMMRLPPLTVEGALDRGEVTALITSRGLCAMGLATSFVGSSYVRDFAGVMFLYALALVVYVLVRDLARSRFLRRVYRGEHPELRIVRDDEVSGFELLSPVMSGTITNAVIAHVSTTHGYRTSHGPRALARVTRSFAQMDARLSRRRRGALLVGAATLTSALLALVNPFRSPMPAHAQTKPQIGAPACRDATAYFEDRLQAIPGVGRATLVAGDHDGLVVYVPKAGFTATPELDAKVLGTALLIPCSDKLALTLAQPRYVAFDVSAELVVGEGADAAAVQRDAEEQVRALFQPDARAIDSEHFGFGATEKTFGYRVRHALRHVSGVTSVKLVVDGSDREVPLEATDFPTLGSLSIGVVR